MTFFARVAVAVSEALRFFEVCLTVDVAEVANPDSVKDSDFEDATVVATPADKTTIKARTAEAARTIELETARDLLTARRTVVAADELILRTSRNERTLAFVTAVVIEAAIFFATVFDCEATVDTETDITCRNAFTAVAATLDVLVAKTDLATDRMAEIDAEEATLAALETALTNDPDVVDDTASFLAATSDLDTEDAADTVTTLMRVRFDIAATNAVPDTASDLAIPRPTAIADDEAMFRDIAMVRRVELATVPTDDAAILLPIDTDLETDVVAVTETI
jgi:hypothetical protein